MNDNKNKILEMGPHSFMTVSELAAFLKRNAGHFSDVMITGYDKDGNFISLSSSMSRKDALWIIKEAEKNVMDY